MIGKREFSFFPYFCQLKLYSKFVKMPMDENVSRPPVQWQNISFSRFDISSGKGIRPCRQLLPAVKGAARTFPFRTKQARKNLCFAQTSKGLLGMHFPDLRL